MVSSTFSRSSVLRFSCTLFVPPLLDISILTMPAFSPLAFTVKTVSKSMGNW